MQNINFKSLLSTNQIFPQLMSDTPQLSVEQDQDKIRFQVIEQSSHQHDSQHLLNTSAHDSKVVLSPRSPTEGTDFLKISPSDKGKRLHQASRRSSSMLTKNQQKHLLAASSNPAIQNKSPLKPLHPLEEEPQSPSSSHNNSNKGENSSLIEQVKKKIQRDLAKNKELEKEKEEEIDQLKIFQSMHSIGEQKSIFQSFQQTQTKLNGQTSKAPDSQEHGHSRVQRKETDLNTSFLPQLAKKQTMDLQTHAHGNLVQHRQRQSMKDTHILQSGQILQGGLRQFQNRHSLASNFVITPSLGAKQLTGGSSRQDGMRFSFQAQDITDSLGKTATQEGGAQGFFSGDGQVKHQKSFEVRIDLNFNNHEVSFRDETERVRTKPESKKSDAKIGFESEQVKSSKSFQSNLSPLNRQQINQGQTRNSIAEDKVQILPTQQDIEKRVLPPIVPRSEQTSPKILLNDKSIDKIHVYERKNQSHTTKSRQEIEKMLIHIDDEQIKIQDNQNSQNNIKVQREDSEVTFQVLMHKQGQQMLIEQGQIKLPTQNSSNLFHKKHSSLPTLENEQYMNSIKSQFVKDNTQLHHSLGRYNRNLEESSTLSSAFNNINPFKHQLSQSLKQITSRSTQKMKNKSMMDCYRDGQLLNLDSYDPSLMIESTGRLFQVNHIKRNKQRVMQMSTQLTSTQASTTLIGKQSKLQEYMNSNKIRQDSQQVLSFQDYANNSHLSQISPTHSLTKQVARLQHIRKSKRQNDTHFQSKNLRQEDRYEDEFFEEDELLAGLGKNQKWLQPEHSEGSLLSKVNQEHKEIKVVRYREIDLHNRSNHKLNKSEVIRFERVGTQSPRTISEVFDQQMSKSPSHKSHTDQISPSKSIKTISLKVLNHQIQSLKKLTVSEEEQSDIKKAALLKVDELLKKMEQLHPYQKSKFSPSVPKPSNASVRKSILSHTNFLARNFGQTHDKNARRASRAESERSHNAHEESKRDQTEYLKKHNVQSNIKFATKEELKDMNTKFDYRVVKESSISLAVLYNESINKLKDEEKELCKEPKPLAFSIKEGKNGGGKTIRFEILGQNAQIEALLENEEELEAQDPVVEQDNEIEALSIRRLSSQAKQNPKSALQRTGSRRQLKNQQFSIMIPEESGAQLERQGSLLSRKGSYASASQSPAIYGQRAQSRQRISEMPKQAFEFMAQTPKALKGNTLFLGVEQSIQNSMQLAISSNLKEANTQQLSPLWNRSPRQIKVMTNLKINDLVISSSNKDANQNSGQQQSDMSSPRIRINNQNFDSKRQSVNFQPQSPATVPNKKTLGGNKPSNSATVVQKELKLEKILEQNARDNIYGNQVINVDFKQSRLQKLSKLSKQMQITHLQDEENGTNGKAVIKVEGMDDDSIASKINKAKQSALFEQKQTKLKSKTPLPGSPKNKTASQTVLPSLSSLNITNLPPEAALLIQQAATHSSPLLTIGQVQNYQKLKLYGKWYLSPKQMSERCKFIEQISKPSQQRDISFQDRKTVKDLISEIKGKYQIVEEPEISSEDSEEEDWDDTDADGNLARRNQAILSQNSYLSGRGSSRFQSMPKFSIGGMSARTSKALQSMSTDSKRALKNLQVQTSNRQTKVSRFEPSSATVKQKEAQGISKPLSKKKLHHQRSQVGGVLSGEVVIQVFDSQITLSKQSNNL